MTSLLQFGLFSQCGSGHLVAAVAVNHAGYKSLPTSLNLSFFSQSVECFHHLYAHYDRTFNVLLHFAYASINDSNDTYSLKEMLKLDDVAKFVEAMIKEVNDHEKQRFLDLCPQIYNT